MARRGYFERQSGSLRARLALPGEDVDDPNLSPNKIAFDSQAFGTLSMFDSGQGVIPNRAAYDAGTWVASGWGLPYVPLCMIRYRIQSTENIPLFWSVALSSTIAGYEGETTVTKNGIFIRSNHTYTTVPSNPFPIQVAWTAFRLPV